MPRTPPTSRVRSLTALATERRSGGSPSRMSTVPGVMASPNPKPNRTRPGASVHRSREPGATACSGAASAAKPTAMASRPAAPGQRAPTRASAEGASAVPAPTPTGMTSSVAAACRGLWLRTICRYCGARTNSAREAKNCRATSRAPAVSAGLRKARTSSDGSFVCSSWRTKASPASAATPRVTRVAGAVQPCSGARISRRPGR